MDKVVNRDRPRSLERNMYDGKEFTIADAIQRENNMSQ